MGQDGSESNREPINYGTFTCQICPEIITSIKLERINTKIYRHKISTLLYRICLNKEILPKYTYTYVLRERERDRQTDRQTERNRVRERKRGGK